MDSSRHYKCPITNDWMTDPVKTHNAACYLGRSAPLARDDVKLTETERVAAAQDYPNQAVNLLRQATAADYRNFDHMQSDSDLEAIRDHPGFKALVEGREEDLSPQVCSVFKGREQRCSAWNEPGA